MKVLKRLKTGEKKQQKIRERIDCFQCRTTFYFVLGENEIESETKWIKTNQFNYIGGDKNTLIFNGFSDVFCSLRIKK